LLRAARAVSAEDDDCPDAAGVSEMIDLPDGWSATDYLTWTSHLPGRNGSSPTDPADELVDVRGLPLVTIRGALHLKGRKMKHGG